MATAEVLRSLASSSDLAQSSQQLHKVVKEKSDSLKETIKTIAIQMSEEQDLRENYSILLADLIRKSSSRLSAPETYENIKAALPQAGTKLEHRQRRLAMIFCIAAISRSGLLSSNTACMTQLVQDLFEISKTFEAFRLLSYRIIIEIIETNIKDVDSFRDSIMPILNITDSSIPDNIDSLYLSLRINQIFPQITLHADISSPLSKVFLAKFENQLLETSQFLPSLHPIWPAIASVDPALLLRHSSELWLNTQFSKRPLLTMSTSAAIPLLDPKDLLSLLTNQKLFLTALSIRQNSGFIELVRAKVESLIASNSDSMFDVIVALLSTEGKSHSFIADLVNKGCSHMNDEQTLKMMERLSSISFKALIDLLWAQKHRESIVDFSVIPKIFAAAASKAAGEEEKVELSKFISVNLLRLTPKGQTWFSLISGVEISFSESPQTLQALIEFANLIIAGLNKISEQMALTPIFRPCEFEITSLTKFCSVLSKSSYAHWNEFGKLLLKKAIPFLPSSDSKVLTDPVLLASAIHNSSLCASSIPAFLTYSKDLPNSFWSQFDEASFLDLPLSAEQAKEVLPLAFPHCRGNAKNELQEKMILKLLSKLSSEDQNAIIKSQIERIIVNEANGGIEAVTAFVKRGSAEAIEVLETITKMAPTVTSQRSLRILRDWIDVIAESNEVLPKAIADSMFAAINHEYESTAGGKKKCEAALGWAVKLANKLKRDIPRDTFAPLAPIVVQTGSRVAANMIRQLADLKE